MSYVDVNFYKDEYKGTMIPEDELKHKLELASMDIDSLTYNRIVAKGFNNLTDFQKEKIKWSVCLHADFMYQYGDMFNSPVASYTAGMTSVTFNKNSITGQNGVFTSNDAFNVLKQTGLTVRLFI